MRMTVRRDLVTMPYDQLRELAAKARDASAAADAELARVCAAAGPDTDLGGLVDAFEAHALAARRVAQVHAALAMLGTTRKRGRKGRARHG